MIRLYVSIVSSLWVVLIRVNILLADRALKSPTLGKGMFNDNL